MYSKENVLLDRREMLRIKLFSLATEARRIRREELRTFGGLREELRDHRIKVVRTEARATVLALAIIRAKAYRDIEERADVPPNWEKVEAMLVKYGPVGTKAADAKAMIADSVKKPAKARPAVPPRTRQQYTLEEIEAQRRATSGHGVQPTSGHEGDQNSTQVAFTPEPTFGVAASQAA